MNVNKELPQEPLERTADQALTAECGCCFEYVVYEEMFQCAEGHLFCGDCCRSHAETRLGEQKITFPCMDTSACAAVFPDSELLRFLPEKTMALYDSLKQARDIQDANIENLESCPACPYAAIVDNPRARSFACGRDECRRISCRKCRRVQHYPKSCAENAREQKLSGRQGVEEAMSEALIRTCPNCFKPFLKVSGCNKITCISCGKWSCYVCHKALNESEGYGHFFKNGDGHDSRVNRSDVRCQLFDEAYLPDLDKTRIKAARDQAKERIKADAKARGVEIRYSELEVALP